MKSASTQGRGRNTGQLLVFAVLVGLLAVATSEYRYGSGSQLVHLPEILRTLDAGYLANDFWLNAQDAFGPRFYYRLAFAAAASVVPLWVAYAAAFALAVVAVSVATALATRDLTGSALAAVVATPLAMWTMPFFLAGWPAIRAASAIDLTPDLLVEPLCFLALWRGIRGRPMPAAAISVPAILLHPTFGLATAAVALAASLAHLGAGPAESPLARRHGAWAVAAGAGTVVIAVLGFWIVPGLLSGAIFVLEGSEFVHLVAHVRHPHHLLPSTWLLADLLRFAVFWAAGLVVLAGWARCTRLGQPPERAARTARAIAVAFAAVACGLACGWFFVEAVPTRWAATAYLFRLQTLVAWLCWIVLAAAVADAARQGWPQAMAWLRPRAPRLLPWLGAPRLRWAALLCLSAALAGVVAAVALLRAQMLPETPLVDRISERLGDPPTFTLHEARAQARTRSGEAALAAAARATTPPDAVFLIPDDWWHWRLHAERAAVVDWKAFPFRELQMRAWQERYVATFDLEQGIGYPARATERWLRKLAAQFHFDYAVVPRSSCLPWETVAASGRWKLVAVAL